MPRSNENRHTNAGYIVFEECQDVEDFLSLADDGAKMLLQDNSAQRALAKAVAQSATVLTLNCHYSRL